MKEIIDGKVQFYVSDSEHLILKLHSLHLCDFTSAIIEELPNCIQNLMIETGKTKILIDLAGEGIAQEPMQLITTLLKGWIQKYAVPINNVLITCGAAPVVKNVEKYFDHCKKLNSIPFNIQFQNTYEQNATNGFLLPKLEFYDVFDTTPRIKQKIFLSFNRSNRLHRLYLTSEMIRRNLLDKAFFSMDINYSLVDDPDSYLTYLFNSIDVFFPKNHVRTDDILRSNKTLFPIELNLAKHPNRNPHDIIQDVRYFNESYFSLVTETKFLRDLPEVPDTQLDCYLFSEKTYKPILAKHPFILMSIPGSLAVLRQGGYKTFHPYIDESYDSIVDDEDRIEAIINEVERLSKFTDTEWLLWQENVRNIVEHNFKNLKNSKLVTIQSKDYE
jgi:hypothetical protein